MVFSEKEQEHSKLDNLAVSEFVPTVQHVPKSNWRAGNWHADHHEQRNIRQKVDHTPKIR